MLKIFNTLTQKKEIIKSPANQKSLKLFVCGPTAYDYSHIGHARTYIAFDIIVKYLRSQKYKIFYLQNITDIDDKIINRAQKQKKNPLTLARFFEKEYYRDIKTIGVKSVNKYARASDYIKEMQKQIKRLIDRDFAYITKNGVYFEIKKFKKYGELSKQNLRELKKGTRFEIDKFKRDPLDFVLWKTDKSESNCLHYYEKDCEQIPVKKKRINAKKYKPIMINKEPLWHSPWGLGRPGWHIEDTAISEKFFGPQYDLHGGALDLKFPHHESEIAQQEAASGKKPFVKIWLHTGFLLVKNEKMSKSLGNFITIRDFLKKYPPEILRFIVFSHHYRSPINYNEKLADNAQKSIDTIKEFLEKLEFVKKSKIQIHSRYSEIIQAILIADKKFNQAMDDDFNTPKALSAIFDFISSFQDKIWQIETSHHKTIIKFINEKLDIFGIKIKSAKIPQKIKNLARQREKLRNNKQFIPADLLRKKIESLGYIIEDTPIGPLVKRKSEALNPKFLPADATHQALQANPPASLRKTLQADETN